MFESDSPPSLPEPVAAEPIVEPPKKRKSSWDKLASMFNLPGDRSAREAPAPVPTPVEQAPRADVVSEPPRAKKAPTSPEAAPEISDEMISFRSKPPRAEVPGFGESAKSKDSNAALDALFGDAPRDRSEGWGRKRRVVDDISPVEDVEAVVELPEAELGEEVSRADAKSGDVEEGSDERRGRRRRRRGRGRSGADSSDESTEAVDSKGDSFGRGLQAAEAEPEEEPVARERPRRQEPSSRRESAGRSEADSPRSDSRGRSEGRSREDSRGRRGSSRGDSPARKEAGARGEGRDRADSRRRNGGNQPTSSDSKVWGGAELYAPVESSGNWDEPDSFEADQLDAAAEVPATEESPSISERRSNRRRRRGRGRGRTSEETTEVSGEESAAPTSRAPRGDAADAEVLPDTDAAREDAGDGEDDRGGERDSSRRRRRRRPAEARRKDGEAGSEPVRGPREERSRDDRPPRKSSPRVVDDGDDDAMAEDEEKHRNIPTWQDSLETLVTANIDNHKKHEHRGGPRGGRSRGRR
ncbi:hypothetical protein [Aureliella helgolandensis]|nr:hypothetical protein [Aureliella helgolandensis]